MQRALLHVCLIRRPDRSRTARLIEWLCSEPAVPVNVRTGWRLLRRKEIQDREPALTEASRLDPLPGSATVTSRLAQVREPRGSGR